MTRHDILRSFYLSCCLRATRPRIRQLAKKVPVLKVVRRGRGDAPLRDRADGRTRRGWRYGCMAGSHIVAGNVYVVDDGPRQSRRRRQRNRKASSKAGRDESGGNNLPCVAACAATGRSIEKGRRHAIKMARLRAARSQTCLSLPISSDVKTLYYYVNCQ